MDEDNRCQRLRRLLLQPNFRCISDCCDDLIPYVIESPGTAEDVSQFLTISGSKDETQDRSDGVCRAGDRFNVLLLKF